MAVFPLPDYGWSEARQRGRTADTGLPGVEDVQLAETKQRLTLLRATVEALPDAWPTDPLHRCSRAMLMQIVTLLTKPAERPARRL